MALKKLKPTSAGKRFVVQAKEEGLYVGRPYSKLTTKRNRNGGRNNNGRITTRHRGGGHKRLYRLVDFKRNKDGVPAQVERIEYDPNRSANIALVLYKDGERRYILAPKGLKQGQPISSGPDASIKPGNTLPLANIPVGTQLHAVELRPGKGAQLARSAGVAVQLVSKAGEYASIRLRSGEIRRIHVNCRATIGVVGNHDHALRSLGKAGAKRHQGRRPKVRGIAMNPVDHPHGGGEGRTNGGRHPTSPWGWKTKGYKTRTNKRSEKFILRRRNAKNGGN